jgi:carbamoyltransferase
MHILGISAFYHDSAACLVRDGVPVAAAQEERFTRTKHDAAFPTHAVRYCLEEAGIGAGDLDHVVFYDKPLLKFERLLETWIGMAPRGFRMFLTALPVWLKRKLHTVRELDRGLEGGFRGRYAFTEHHESHAASAFFPSPFEEAAVLTLDGVGEWACGSLAHGRGHRIEMREEMRFPHSLGLLYTAFTWFCGFRVNSGEYKLMGLAPYGEPRYEERIRERLLRLHEDGSFHLDLSWFGFLDRAVMTSRRFERLFDGPRRLPEAPLTQREMDIAASIQRVTEDAMLRSARHAHELTGSPNLCLAGGVALNCVGNGRILREGPFERVWIQPAAGDAGGALGAALFVWHQLLGRERVPQPQDAQAGSLLGPRFEGGAVRAFLDGAGARYATYEDEDTLTAEVARLLADGKVVGHMAGRMEFGPRALGNRSILGDPRSPAMQSLMNRKIKFRESFRPFAPAVLRERACEWFDLEPGQESPYMLLVAAVRPERRCALDDEGQGLEKLRRVRSQVPAVTHVDLSARIQTVDAGRNPRFHRLLTRFEALTGCPMLINTSFNVRGEPIVCTPRDAWECFLATDMDVLVIEDCLLRKEEQVVASKERREAHLARFALD